MNKQLVLENSIRESLLDPKEMGNRQGARAPSVRCLRAGRPRRTGPAARGTSPEHVISPLPTRVVTLSVNTIEEGNVRHVTGGGRGSITSIVRVDVRAGRVAVIRGGSGERAFSLPECPVLRVRTPAASEPAPDDHSSASRRTRCCSSPASSCSPRPPSGLSQVTYSITVLSPLQFKDVPQLLKLN